MAYWLEIHCDVRAPDDKRKVRLNPPCYTDNAAAPGLLYANGRVREGIAQLKRDARAEGWKLTKRGWECPYCQTQQGE